MQSIALTSILFASLLLPTVVGAQTTTQTNCTSVTPGMINCSSRTSPQPAYPALRTQSPADAFLAAQRNAAENQALRAQAQAAYAQEDRARNEQLARIRADVVATHGEEDTRRMELLLTNSLAQAWSACGVKHPERPRSDKQMNCMARQYGAGGDYANAMNFFAPYNPQLSAVRGELEMRLARMKVAGR